MKRKDLQPRQLNPTRLILKFGGEIKSFSDKKKVKEYVTTKSGLQEMLKENVKC